MKQQKNKIIDDTHLFLTMWDCLGFETIIDVTEREQKAVWDKLQGKDSEVSIPFNAMMLRARFNPQRNPEIYSFRSDVDLETLIEMSKSCPQELVNKIRKHGKKLFGEIKQKDVIV